MDKEKTLIIALTGNLLSDQRMQRIASALNESGWRIHVYYRNYFKYRAASKPESGHYPYQTFGIKTPFKGGILFYGYYNLILFFKLLFKPCSTLYAVDSDTLPALAILSRLRSIPLVYDAHEYFAEVPELHTHTFKKKIWHLITRLGVKTAKLNITVGQSLAIELEKVYGKPFVCIRNVPLKSNVQESQRYQKPVILYQGALNKGRMLERLISAMSHLPDFHCIIAGEGDLSLTLRQKAAGMDNVEFVGLMSPSDLKTLTPNCFAGYNLLEAANSLSYHYSLSNKYFDYMHAGVPSISSVLPEYLALNSQWNCGVCIENDENALIHLLKDWQNNPALYAKLKENAKFAATENHWDKEKQILTHLLQP